MLGKIREKIRGDYKQTLNKEMYDPVVFNLAFSVPIDIVLCTVLLLSTNGECSVQASSVESFKCPHLFQVRPVRGVRPLAFVYTRVSYSKWSCLLSCDLDLSQGSPDSDSALAEALGAQQVVPISLMLGLCFIHFTSIVR